MADRRVKKIVKSDKKKSKSADKKSNTQAIRREKYITILQSMQEGSQPYVVLKHLIRKGYTSSLEIATLYHITNPTAVVSDLRKKGCDISLTYITQKNTKGERKRWGKLTLEV